MRSPLAAAMFLSVVALVVALSHRYFYSRTVARLGLSDRLRRLGRRLWIASGVGLVGGMMLSRSLPPALGVPVALMVFSWFGFLALLLPATLAGEAVPAVLAVWRRVARSLGGRVPGLGGALAGRDAPVSDLDGLADPGRRAALHRFTAALTGAGATSVAAGGMHTAFSGPEIVRRTIRLPRLPAAFEGLRIAQLSDVHVGPLIGRGYTEGVAAQVRALAPDLVVITGDLIDGSVEQLADGVAPLLDIPSAYGTFYCTGNHEYYSGADAWCAHLESQGVHVLRNRRLTLERGPDALDLIGVDDVGTRGAPGDFDLDAACAGRPADRCAVLLCHQPKGVDAAAALDIDLVLSGHTHGGQIWPYGLLVVLAQPYVSGLHQHTERTWIYVHRGTGFWGPPVRVRVPAEIALLTLTRGDSGPA